MTRLTIAYKSGYIFIADDVITISHINQGSRSTCRGFSSLAAAKQRIRDYENLGKFLYGWKSNTLNNAVMRSSKHRLYFVVFRGVPLTPFFTHEAAAVFYLENKKALGA